MNKNLTNLLTACPIQGIAGPQPVFRFVCSQNGKFKLTTMPRTHTHTHMRTLHSCVVYVFVWLSLWVCVCVFASFPCCVPLTPLALSAVSAVGKSQTLHGTRQSVCVWLCNALRAPRCRSAIATASLNQRTRIEHRELVEYILDQQP